MPAGDRRGPAGYGPMTGRGAGYCAGYDVPGYMNQEPGFGNRGYGRGGFGRGGGGRGWRNMYRATGLTGWERASYGYPAYGGAAYSAAPAPGPTDELNMLRNQADALGKQMEAVRSRISALEKTREKGE